MMHDACGASIAAAKSVFRDCDISMCYFHLMQAIRDCKKQIGDDYDKVMDEIRSLHWSKNEQVFKKRWEVIGRRWSKNFKWFYDYFVKYWIKKNNHWRIYDSPPGYAKTNSPIESFNSSIKRDFTNRKRSSVLGFITKMAAIIKYYSDDQRVFATVPKPTDRMITESNTFKVGQFRKVNMLICFTKIQPKFILIQ
jgi:transposase-like protein